MVVSKRPLGSDGEGAVVCIEGPVGPDVVVVWMLPGMLPVVLVWMLPVGVVWMVPETPVEPVWMVPEEVGVWMPGGEQVGLEALGVWMPVGEQVGPEAVGVWMPVGEQVAMPE